MHPSAEKGGSLPRGSISFVSLRVMHLLWCSSRETQRCISSISPFLRVAPPLHTTTLYVVQPHACLPLSQICRANPLLADAGQLAALAMLRTILSNCALWLLACCYGLFYLQHASLLHRVQMKEEEETAATSAAWHDVGARRHLPRS